MGQYRFILSATRTVDIFALRADYAVDTATLLQLSLLLPIAYQVNARFVNLPEFTHASRTCFSASTADSVVIKTDIYTEISRKFKR